MELINQINKHKYLYLDKLIELKDLELEIWINEAGAEESGNQFSKNTSLYNAIETNEFSKRYKITFNNYVSYSVRNESYTVLDEYEVFSGNLFRIYTKSKYLDYVSVAVEMFIVEHTQKEELKNYGLICLNQIIDVATCEGPIIKEIL